MRCRWTDHDEVMAELYGLKVCFMCLLYIAFDNYPNRAEAFGRLAESVSESIDVF